MRKSNKKYNKKYNPLVIPYELDEYGLGSWLKKHAGTIGLTAGALGAMALTGGLAAPAVAPGLAAASGTALASTGAAATGAGLSGVLGAASLGSSIGSSIGGSVQQQYEQTEAEQRQRGLENLNENLYSTQAMNKRLQNQQVQNTPIYQCGGKLKQFAYGGPNTEEPGIAPMSTTPIQTNVAPTLAPPTYLSGRGDSLKGALQAEANRMYNEASWKGSKNYYKTLGTSIKNLPTNKLRGQEEFDYYINTVPQIAEAVTKYNFSPKYKRGFSYQMPIVSNDSIITATGNPQRYGQLLANPPMTKKAEGGIINYSGQTHEGPDNGIPVDAQGNPAIVSKNKPIALTENKEVTWLTPEGDSYVFSDKLGYSQKANKLIGKYKKRLGSKLDGVDELSWKGLNNDLSKLSEQQETERETRVNKLTSKIDKYKKEMGSYINLVEHELGGYMNLIEHETGGPVGYLDNPMMQMEDGSYLDIVDHTDNLEQLGSGNWIQKAINPAHKGYCTPMTKSTCTPHRKALAMRFKHGDLSKHAMGGPMQGFLEYSGTDPNVISQYLPDVFKPDDITIPYTKGYNAEQIPIEDFQLETIPDRNISPIQLPKENKLTPFTGNVSPLGALGSVAGNALLLSSAKNKSRNINLPRVNAEQISLEQQRANAKENYLSARANLMQNLKNAGLSPTQYTQAVLGGTRDLNTLANQTIGQSLESEANTNVGLRGQASQQNAQIAMQEATANMQAQQENDYMKQQYLANILQAPLNYLGERQRATQMYDTANAEGKVGIYNDPKNTLAQRLLGLKKYQIKARK